MKAIILAGGTGTRFRPLTFTKPKPMLPLLNRPILHYIIQYLRGHGLTDIYLTTNYLKDQIMKYFGDGSSYGVNLFYPVEENPLGTAGSVKNIKNLDDTIVVIQGDNITDIDLGRLINFHKNSGGLCTIAVMSVNDPWHYGIVELEDIGKVKRFCEKPPLGNCFSNLINTGVYVLEPKALKFIPENREFDFAKDMFPILLEKGSLYGCVVDGFWTDVGKVDGYIRALEWMLEKNKIGISIGENVEIGKNVEIIEPIVIGNDTVIENNCIVGGTVIGNGCKIKENSDLRNSILFENSIIGNGSILKDCIVAEGCVSSSRLEINQNSIVGPNCNIGINVRITPDSRIWPNIHISQNSIVSGNIMKFFRMSESKGDPKWYLRRVLSGEAFYFNTSKNNHVSYTGFRANTLIDFSNILERVEIQSLHYHLRGNINDFEQWVRLVIGDAVLAWDFQKIKNEMLFADELRKKLIEKTRVRVNDLIRMM